MNTPNTKVHALSNAKVKRSRKEHFLARPTRTLPGSLPHAMIAARIKACQYFFYATNRKRDNRAWRITPMQLGHFLKKTSLLPLEETRFDDFFVANSNAKSKAAIDSDDSLAGTSVDHLVKTLRSCIDVRSPLQCISCPNVEMDKDFFSRDEGMFLKNRQIILVEGTLHRRPRYHKKDHEDIKWKEKIVVRHCSKANVREEFDYLFQSLCIIMPGAGVFFDLRTKNMDSNGYIPIPMDWLQLDETTFLPKKSPCGYYRKWKAALRIVIGAACVNPCDDMSRWISYDPMIHCRQLDDYNEESPVVLPDVMLNESNNSVIPIKMDDEEQHRAHLRSMLANSKTSRVHCRHYWRNRLHQNLPNDVHIIDTDEVNNHDIAINIEGHNNKLIATTVVCVRVCDDPLLLSKLQQFNMELVQKPGNARKKSGDIGEMYVIGSHLVQNEETDYVPINNGDVRSLCHDCCILGAEFARNNFADLYQTIKSTEAMLGRTVPYYMGGENGISCQLNTSCNLGNASHYDAMDASPGFLIWVEQSPGDAKNWYFLMPNVVYNGKRGMAIKLGHGVAVQWDGRLVRHCSTVVQTSKNNMVHGTFWCASCKSVNNTDGNEEDEEDDLDEEDEEYHEYKKVKKEN